MVVDVGAVVVVPDAVVVEELDDVEVPAEEVGTSFLTPEPGEGWVVAMGLGAGEGGGVGAGAGAATGALTGLGGGAATCFLTTGLGLVTETTGAGLCTVGLWCDMGVTATTVVTVPPTIATATTASAATFKTWCSQ